MDAERRVELLKINSTHFVDWLELRELKQTMSNTDFEVMPRGTTEEIRVLRKFAREMISLSKIHDMPLPHEVRTKVGLLEMFYNAHTEKYPV